MRTTLNSVRHLYPGKPRSGLASTKVVNTDVFERPF